VWQGSSIFLGSKNKPGRIEMPSSTQLQLIARGEQDAILTSNPQFSFFKTVHRRYTPFATESIPIEFNGTPDFGQRIDVEIPRSAGDLLHRLNIEVDLPGLTGVDNYGNSPYWVNDIGFALIQDVSIYIGEKLMDKHTGEWLKMESERTVDSSKRPAFNLMVGHWNSYPPPQGLGGLSLTIPLRFWFCKSMGAALPLISLQTQSIRLVINLRPFQQLWWSDSFPVGPGSSQPIATPQKIQRFQMFGDFVFLASPERRAFASRNHEYLIEQLQISPKRSVSPGMTQMTVPLFFNHPCKEFFWVIQLSSMLQAQEIFNFGSETQNGAGSTVGEDLLATAQLRLDGMERFFRRTAPYFRLSQPFYHHSAVSVPPVFIYSYSFALQPESTQPSGTLNCSLIEDIIMYLTFNPTQSATTRTVQFYATNYNVFRIDRGVGDLMYIA